MVVGVVWWMWCGGCGVVWCGVVWCGSKCGECGVVDVVWWMLCGGCGVVLSVV